MFSHIRVMQQTPVRIFKCCQDLPASIHQIDMLSLTGLVRHSLLDAFAIRMCFQEALIETLRRSIGLWPVFSCYLQFHAP